MEHHHQFQQVVWLIYKPIYNQMQHRGCLGKQAREVGMTDISGLLRDDFWGSSLPGQWHFKHPHLNRNTDEQAVNVSFFCVLCFGWNDRNDQWFLCKSEMFYLTRLQSARGKWSPYKLVWRDESEGEGAKGIQMVVWATHSTQVTKILAGNTSAHCLGMQNKIREKAWAAGNVYMPNLSPKADELQCKSSRILSANL